MCGGNAAVLNYPLQEVIGDVELFVMEIKNPSSRAGILIL